MFGRKNVVTAASDALDGVSPYVDQLAHDEKLRQRLGAAIAAGAAARKRARRQTGLRGLAMRLATDPVLRAQVAEATVQLQKANSRLKKHRSHKLRNTVLFLTGVGAVVAAVPSARETVLSKLGLDSDDDYGPAEPPPAAGPAGYDMPDV
ncbi:MAG TPA: hypothetical protein VH210_15810 [Gaiellaceae bacterium]|jgi:hypothetical protein|nr:hypothetical protein [Gaiellaceae bacterium]